MANTQLKTVHKEDLGVFISDDLTKAIGTLYSQLHKS